MKLFRFFLAAVLGAAVSASVGAEFPNPYPAPVSGVRLTPETPLSPSINGARVVGASPGSCVLFQVPVSGERPMKIRAAGLPPGLDMDARGLITGTAPAGKGEYKVGSGFQQAWKGCEGAGAEGGGGAVPHSAHGVEQLVLLQ